METKQPPRFITTNELAKILRVQPATIRRGYCVNGHYLGLRARKLANKRLLWSEDNARRLVCVEP